MIQRLIARGGCLALGLLLCAPQASLASLTEPPGELPNYQGFDLSPDGRRLLMMVARDESYDLVVRDLDGGDGIDRTLYEADPKTGLLNWCRWANDTRIICSLRTYRVAGRAGQVIRTRMVAIDHDGGNLLRLVPRAKNYDRRAAVFNAQVQDRVLSWLGDDDEHILVQLNRDAPNRPSVYRLNIYNNRLLRVVKPRSSVRRWYANHEGQVVMAMGYIRDTDPVMYRFDGRALHRFRDPAFNSEVPPAPLGFSGDDKYVFMNMTNGEDRHGVYKVELESGQVVDTVFEDPEFDVFGNLVLHPETGHPVGVKYLQHHPHTVWFDDTLERLFSGLRDALPGEHLEIKTSDTGYDRMVLKTYGGIVPRFYLYDREAGQIDLIGREFDSIADEAIVDLRSVTYRSRDGVTIPAYLARPANSEGKLPTVLFPHGGPYARDSAEFDYWTQFFVDQGYVVLKPNYRGSVGYGEMFMRSGYRQWGLKMQEDLLDGLDWLVAEGIADPDRVCVVGASFGGYSALVAAFKHSDRIRCAVSMAGITDLEKLVQRIYEFDLVERNRIRIQSGEALRANSPLHQAEHFDVPVLLVHGEQDTVVRTRQSRRLADVLTELNKPVEYIEQPGGDHFMSVRSQREEFFTAMDRFLDQHLGR